MLHLVFAARSVIAQIFFLETIHTDEQKRKIVIQNILRMVHECNVIQLCSFMHALGIVVAIEELCLTGINAGQYGINGRLSRISERDSCRPYLPVTHPVHETLQPSGSEIFVKLLLRHEALKHCRLFDESASRVLLVEARTGQDRAGQGKTGQGRARQGRTGQDRARQGKTALVLQYEAGGERPFFWVNCQDRHRDPSVLCAEVLGVSSEGVPRERLEELHDLLRQQMLPG